MAGVVLFRFALFIFSKRWRIHSPELTVPGLRFALGCAEPSPLLFGNGRQSWR